MASLCALVALAEAAMPLAWGAASKSIVAPMTVCIDCAGGQAMLALLLCLAAMTGHGTAQQSASAANEQVDALHSRA